MLRIAGLLHQPQPYSLQNVFAEKACLPLRTSVGKSSRVVVQRYKSRTCRGRTPSQCQRQIVACAHATLPIAFQPLITRDLTATALAAVGAYVWVRLFDWMATQGVLEQTTSRKLVHITSGPLFVLTWPLFSSGSSARCCAAVVPLLNALRLVLVGTGAVKSEGTVKAVSRGGDRMQHVDLTCSAGTYNISNRNRQELLRGPLFYVLIMTAVTVVFWRDSPVGMMVLSLMCGGDGLADIIGRRYGTAKLPFNKAKSWAGSLAMFTGGALMSLAFIALYNALGYFPYNVQTLLPTVLSTSLVACAVESLPINEILDDNFSVPAVTAVMGHFLLQAIQQSTGVM